MYTPIDACKTPKDSTRIWRYMEFHAFVSMLQSQTLWFTSLEDLRQMDPYEGAWTDAAKEGFLSVYENNPDALSVLGETPSEALSAFRTVFRKTFFVNCWHMNPDESAAMWKVYGGDSGLAIVSTVGRLKESLVVNGIAYHIGQVKYEDVVDHPSPNPTMSCFRKRRSFSHERELRVAFVSGHDCHGVPLHLELGKLIARVYVSPVGKPWLRDVVERELQTYGIHAPVERSPLYERTLR